jgi:hypothetical protein
MSKTTKEVSAVDLVGVTLPVKTETYTVISHGFIIDEVRNALRRAGFEVLQEQYRANNNLEVARGSYIIRRAEDPSFMMSFSWVNSYDKSTKFQCAVGGYIWDNNSFVIDKEDNAFIRKHTGDADTLVKETIKEKIENAEKHYRSVLDAKHRMEGIKLTRSQVAKILGELYFSYDMLSIEQLSGIKKEYTKPSYVYSSDVDSLWTMYCHILTIIKGSHPKLWLQQQSFIHNYIKVNYLMDSLTSISTPLSPTMPEAVEIIEHLETPVPAELEDKGWDEEIIEDELIDDTPEITGIPNGVTMSDTDDLDTEDDKKFEYLIDNDLDDLETVEEEVVEAEESDYTIVKDKTIVEALQNEINNIFGEETSITVYLEGSNYNVVTNDGQEVTVPVTYVESLVK